MRLPAYEFCIPLRHPKMTCLCPRISLLNIKSPRITNRFPAWSPIIAAYVLTLKLGRQDTNWALILLGLASPFALFLFPQFAMTLPEELFQAARIDGAHELQLWWLITLPLSRSVLPTLAIFPFVAHWNDFLWPLLVLNKPKIYTMPASVSVIMYQS